MVPFEDRGTCLRQADIVVCSTSAPGVVISIEVVREAMKGRVRPLLLIDLAMPRDVEGSVGSLENVYLYNLDDLATVAEKNRVARLAEADRGRQVLVPRSLALWSQLQMQFVMDSESSNVRRKEKSLSSRNVPSGAFA